MDLEIIEIPYVYVFYKYVWVAHSRYKIIRGKWNFYIGDLDLKVPYTKGQCLDCRSRATPDRKKLASGKLDKRDFGRYGVDDWKGVLFKSAKQRIIENYIASKRLYVAGLGPAVRGICHIKKYMVLGRNWAPVDTYALKIDNVFDLPKKTDATKGEIISAGVELDQIESCLRQQVNGYVIDLNSVCGVMPIDADEEIAEIDHFLNLNIG
jgi:hypothetical protein